MALPLLAAALLLAQAPPPSAVEGIAPAPGRPGLLVSGVPEIPEALAERLWQYLEVRSASLRDVGADGRAVLVATRFGNTAQLHLVEQPLGARTQLTFFREPVQAARFLPGDPQSILYLQDRGGAEQYQIHRLDRRTGRSALLTDGKSRHQAFALSRDGRRMAYSGTGRNGKDTDVYLAQLGGPHGARLLVQGEGTFSPVEFSPDGRSLLVVKLRSIADADLLLVDVESGERRPLTPAEGKGSVRAAAFSADGKSVLLVTDRYGEFNELYRLDLAVPGRSPRSLTRNLRWNVEDLAVARDGSRVAFTVNADGYSRLYLLDPGSGKVEPGRAPAGVIGSVAFPDGRSDVLFLSVATPTSPLDVWQLDLRTGKLARWTRSETGGLDPASFVEPQLVRYPSADGVSVPALLYLPRRAAFPGRRPVVVYWHGGPEGQERPDFWPLAQFLAGEGMAVLLPNVRGSDGYGKAYLAMDDGVRREQALADIGATLDFVASRPELDPARVAAYGGSYGGYLTLATAAFFPERIRAAVDVVGISSLPTFLEATADYRRDLRRAEYGDERIPEVRAVQERISPLNRAGAIQAALFVLQGKNDPRVPQSEAEQIVKAVRAGGREVWYLLALDEGHGFRKKENRDFATQATVLFLERVLARGGE